MACERCTQGDTLPGTPTGTITSNKAYLAAAPEPSSHAIVLLTDAFGLPLVNCKIIADNLSKELACDVWVPDIFDGDPLMEVDALTLPERAGEKMSFWLKLRFIFLIISRLPHLYRSRASVVDPRIDSFITNLRNEKKYDKIGAVGYCFGGACAIRLGSRNLVDSLVIAHPARFTIKEIEAIKVMYTYSLFLGKISGVATPDVFLQVPSAWQCAEDDVWFSESMRNQAEAVFSGRKGTDAFIDYDFKGYKGTTHGFAARPNISIPELKVQYEEAFKNTVEWFKKTLVV